MLGNVIFAAGFTLLAAAAVAAWAVWRWRQLELSLFPDAASTAPALRLPNLMGAADLLKLANNWIEPEGTPLGRAASACLARLREDPTAVKNIDRQIAKALATDDVSSVLVRTGEDYAYFVVVPERFENARAVGRYAGFANGWAEHLRILDAGLSHPGADVRINAFILFLDGDMGDAALIFSMTEAGRIVAPPMLDAALSPTSNEARADQDGKLMMEIQLAA